MSWRVEVCGGGCAHRCVPLMHYACGANVHDFCAVREGTIAMETVESEGGRTV
jgi:hypothetical protein